MTSKLAELIEAGKALDADECEIAALALQQIDQAEQAEIDAAWDETIDHRLDELTNGTLAPVSGRETRAMGRALLAQRPQVTLDWNEHPEVCAEYLDALARYGGDDGRLGNEFADEADAATDLRPRGAPAQLLVAPSDRLI